MKVIFLMMIGMSLLHADFIKDGDIVKDTQSNLEWQDTKTESKVTWEEAIERCENLELAGHSDWRLPNINELKTTVDVSREDGIVKVFKYFRFRTYCSSTTAENNNSKVWIVDLQEGGSLRSSHKKDDTCYTRCVRGGE